MHYDVIIAIDPDIAKSGVAFLEVRTRKLETSSLSFPQLMDYLIWVKGKSQVSGQKVVVVVEAGWLNNGNWHVFRSDNASLASAKGRQVGRNHETGAKIVEMVKHYGFECVEKKPLRKGWKGKDGKITHEELAYFTNIVGRTSQDMRDAALLAWDYAGLPIRVKV